ncbi:MAG TPA: ATP-binding cassette domain-containing protein [Thermoleophilaceae bacterium]|nr:ATP-binding cassette domain-containing protein [Thermoleophilaceae bacterium]
MAKAIDAAELVKNYPGDVRALDGLSFSVEDGTVFGLLGPNGAGKSTAVRIVTTLARVDAGSARVAGHDVLVEPGKVRDAIGVVGQRAGADREATARENLRLSARLHGVPRAEREARIDELLERFGLSDAADRIVRSFSGGMERRLDIALALVHRPRVLFLDEPTTGLDPEVRADMWQEIERLGREEGMTVLLTTHYLEEADRLAAQLAIVDRGKVVATGSPDELKRELRGDAVQVELDQAELNGARPVLERIPGIAEISVDGRTVRARAEDGARAVPAVLAALDTHGVAVASVTVARPSLDDVYLRYAGRSFGTADAGADKEEVAR